MVIEAVIGGVYIKIICANGVGGGRGSDAQYGKERAGSRVKAFMFWLLFCSNI